MALTRKLLKSMGIEEEKIDQIIDAHTETVDGLKDKYADYDEVKKSLTETQEELKKLQDNPIENTERIAELEKEINDYKTEKTLGEKKEAYKQVLKDSGIDEKRFNSILKLTDFSTVELGKDGKIKDIETLSNSIKEEYADFIIKTTMEEHKPNTPPKIENSTISKEQFSKMNYQQKAKLYETDLEMYNKLQGD